MAIAFDIATEDAWSQHSLLEDRWGLIPLYWEALHVELYGAPAEKRFPASLPPYSVEGEAAMMSYLAVHVTYEDAVDDGAGPKFPHLLLSTESVYLAAAVAPEDWDRPWFGAVATLANETRRLLDILRGLGPASLPYQQASTLHEAAARAAAERRALRLRFVPGERLADAPVLPYTASVEGFDRVIDVKIAHDAVVMTMASLYEYSADRGFICEFEGFDGEARLHEATILYDGAVIRGEMDDGSSFEWQWSLILKICEPLFAEFGDLEAPRRRILDKWRGVGALRRSTQRA